jgi:hypothetical protein
LDFLPGEFYQFLANHGQSPLKTISGGWNSRQVRRGWEWRLRSGFEIFSGYGGLGNFSNLFFFGGGKL